MTQKKVPISDNSAEKSMALAALSTQDDLTPERALCEESKALLPANKNTTSVSKDTQQPISSERALSVGSLQEYINWVNSVPMLTAEEELDCARRLKYQQDLAAARRLVTSHLRLVVKIARSYSGYGLSQADLIQEGNLGLMKAVKRFDPENGARLVSFSVHWIRAEIHEFVLKNWRVVKIATTKAQRKLFFKLRSFSKKRGWFSNDEVRSISEILNVKEEEVRQMESRMSGMNNDCSFHQTDSDGDDYQYSPESYLAGGESPAALLEAQETAYTEQSALHAAIADLPERSQNILRRRWLPDSGKKATLHELAAEFDVSPERIRQLEKQAMNKIKQQILAAS